MVYFLVVLSVRLEPTNTSIAGVHSVVMLLMAIDSSGTVIYAAIANFEAAFYAMSSSKSALFLSVATTRLSSGYDDLIVVLKTWH